MNQHPANSEVIGAVARNRIRQGRYILISLAEDKPMLLKDGLQPEVDYTRALIALYEELGEIAPTNVIRSVNRKLAQEETRA